MKTSQNLALTIKDLAKSQKITVKKMLTDCELSVNTLSSMQSGGCYPRLEAINKIADYLNVSVDYLLGRTDIPTGYSPQFSESNKTTNKEIETISKEDAELLELIKKLPLKKRVKFISALYDEFEE